MIDRDVSQYLNGPMFEALKADPVIFGQLKVEGGTVVWQNGADLCPDVLIWGGPPPLETVSPPQELASQQKSK